MQKIGRRTWRQMKKQGRLRCEPCHHNGAPSQPIFASAEFPGASLRSALHGKTPAHRTRLTCKPTWPFVGRKQGPRVLPALPLFRIVHGDDGRVITK